MQSLFIPFNIAALYKILIDRMIMLLGPKMMINAVPLQAGVGGGTALQDLEKFNV